MSQAGQTTSSGDAPSAGNAPPSRALIVMHGAADQTDRISHARLVAVLDLMRTAGVAVTVAVANDPGGLRMDLRSVADVRVLPVGLPPGRQSLPVLPRAVPPLRRLIRELAPQVIEGDEPMPAIAAGLAAGGSAAPVIYRRHHQSGRRRLHAMSRLASTLADYTAVSNEALVDTVLRDDRADRHRVLVVSSGSPDLRPVAPAEVAALRTRLRIAPGTKVIIVVSRLRREKGIDVLLEALTLVRATPVLTVIAGTGPEAGALERSAARLGCAAAFVSHQDDVALWLAIGDVIAIPSRREALGRTTLEAMAAGKPIVATRVGGLTSAIDNGVNGLLVPPEDPAGLAAAIDRLLLDPGLARALAAEARRRYESRHTVRHMAESWLSAWTRVAAGSPG